VFTKITPRSQKTVIFVSREITIIKYIKIYINIYGIKIPIFWWSLLFMSTGKRKEERKESQGVLGSMGLNLVCLKLVYLRG
jgi:hypothetical protein